MRRIFSFAIVLMLAACSSFQDTPGTVSGVDGDGKFTVTGPKQFGVDPEPTERMFQQAKAVCANAQYITAKPSTADFNLYEFEFRC